MIKQSVGPGADPARAVSRVGSIEAQTAQHASMARIAIAWHAPEAQGSYDRRV